MTKNSHGQIGKIGELAAQRFYINKGYKIVHTNWFCRYGELDLIVKKPNYNETVIVEVKTVSSGTFVNPHEQMSFKKRKSLLKSINNYMENETIPWRFDFIGIVCTKNKLLISYFQNISLINGW